MRPVSSLYALIREACDTYAGQIALLSPGRKPLYFRDLLVQITQVADWLDHHHLHGDSRVAVVLPQGPENATLCLSLMALASCVPINPQYKKAELESLFVRLQIDCVITLELRELETGDNTVAEVAGDLKIPISRLQVLPDACAGQFALTTANKKIASANAVTSTAPDVTDIALVLHTSGSTALPKTVPLTHANLSRSVQHLVQSLGLSGEDRCLNMLPLFHVGGLVDLLLAPLSCGGSVICTTDMRSDTFYRCLEDYRPSWYQGVPVMLQDILSRKNQYPEALEIKSLRFCRAVSASLPQNILAEFESVLGVPVIEIYGMTETAGVITSNPLPPAARKTGSVGCSVGAEVAILDKAGNVVRSDYKGEVIVRGANVFSGYEKMDEVNKQSFINRWFRTGDEGYLDDDGYLFLTGRIKEVINRGGEKISPLEVDRLLLACPGIRDAACFATLHPTLGEEIAVAVVTDSSTPIDAKSIEQYLQPQLAYYKIPRQVYFVESLPRTSGGKLQRHLLSEKLGNLGQADKPLFEAPATPQAKYVAALWQEILGVAAVGIHDNFFELGGDSLKAATFLSRLEQWQGHRIHIGDLFDAPTIHELEAILAQTVKQASVTLHLEEEVHRELAHFIVGWKGKRLRPDSLMVGHNTLGSLPPLFWGCQGYEEFSMLAQQLGSEQPVYGFRSLFRLRHKSPQNNRALAQQYVEEILAIQPQGPYFIGGFCEAGKIAFDIARQLNARQSHKSHEVALLILQEIFIAESYPGPVALLLCDRGAHTPYSHYRDPERGWQRLYRGNISRHVIKAGHEACYREGVIEQFARAIQIEMACTRSGDLSPALLQREDGVALFPWPDAIHRAQINGKMPSLLEPNQTFLLSVTITNNSGNTWQATHQSGISLGSRWRSGKQNRVKIHRDGFAELDHPLHPGDNTTLLLPVRSPSKSGRWQLEVDLVEEGICWFQEKGSQPLIISLRTVRGASLWNRLRNFLRHALSK